MREVHPTREGRQLLLPRWAVPLVWAVIVLIIQILLPWAVSKIGTRSGWDQQIPAAWNYFGLVAVFVGITLYTLCLVSHFRSYKESVRVGFSPPHLVSDGLYRFSRNPMYLSGLFVWLGWVVFYGSLAVFITFIILWLLFSLRVIPAEEHQLEELFGEEYLEYKQSVRRWIGWF